MKNLLSILIAMFAGISIANADPNPSEQFAAQEFNRYCQLMTGKPAPAEIQVRSLTDCYSLLEENGCRFLAPNFDFYHGTAEVIPKVDSIHISDNSRASPKLAFRKLYVEEGHSHTAENLKQMIDWMPKAGYNTLVVPMNYQGHDHVKWDNWRGALTPELKKRDITIEVGGHGYQNFLNASTEDGKLFEKHPEWFGQDKNGKRQNTFGYVFCTSNKEAVSYLISNFLSYVKDRPEIEIYDFWPPDGGKWCECEECKRLGAPADRQAILISQIAQAIKPVRPDLRLEIIAYSTYIAPPEKQMIDKSVLVDFCPINQQFDFQISDPKAEKNAAYADDLRAWRFTFGGDLCIYSYYRKYAWDSLPIVIPHYLQKDVQFYASLPVQGISTYSEPGDWGTYELNHYLLARLARDPNIDIDKTVDEFCAARYGPASECAQKAIGVLEQSFRNCAAIPNSSPRPMETINSSIDDLSAARHCIEHAATQVSEAGHKSAVARLQLMLEYASRDLAIQKLRASNAAEAEIRMQVESLHDWLDSHKDEGVFLVKDQRNSVARTLNRYGIREK